MRATQLRVKPKKDGIYFHLMVKTAQGEFWLEEKDYQDVVYSEILKFTNIYYADVYAICVMSNHWHLCLKMRRPSFDKADIKKRFEQMQKLRVRPRKWSSVLADKWYERFCDVSKLMWDINTTTSRKFNNAFRTSGHLWGSRFKSKLVESGDSLLNVMSYIELNPVRVGIVENPRDYRYSSIGKRSHPEWGESGIIIPRTGWLSKSLTTNIIPENVVLKYDEWVIKLAKRIVSKFSPTKNDRYNQTLIEFAEGRPSALKGHSYGSPDFIDETTKWITKKRHNIYLNRLAKRRTRLRHLA